MEKNDEITPLNILQHCSVYRNIMDSEQIVFEYKRFRSKHILEDTYNIFFFN